MGGPPVVFTIGHSTRPIGEFIRLLRAHGVERLIDIRTVPRSRHNPQFAQEALSSALGIAGIGYLHMAGLGGLRHPRRDSVNTGWKNSGFRGYADYMNTEAFTQSLEECIEIARHERVALMCAEAVPWRCHRSLVADALCVRHIDVCEITSRVRARPHVLTPWAQVNGTRITYPDSEAAHEARRATPALRRSPARRPR